MLAAIRYLLPEHEKTLCFDMRPWNVPFPLFQFGSAPEHIGVAFPLSFMTIPGPISLRRPLAYAVLYPGHTADRSTCRHWD
jgi:hypothetical protein